MCDEREDKDEFGETQVGPMLAHQQERLELVCGIEVTGEFAAQAKRMPLLVRQLLVAGATPSDIRPEELLSALQLPEHTRRSAQIGLDGDAEDIVLRVPCALSAQTCACLRAAVDTEKRARPDTVDGAPDHQLNLSRKQLLSLIGSTDMEVLEQLPLKFGFKDLGLGDADIFVRRYSADSRPWNPFHVDNAKLTINVALGDDSSFQGGKLIACYGSAVRIIPRSEGEATVHASTLLHGVSMMTHGVRYSLIIFLGRAIEENEFDFTDDMRDADSNALVCLAQDINLQHRCKNVLGDSHFDFVQNKLVFLTTSADVGATVENVVNRYFAPHLRPVNILERAWKNDAACWSLYTLCNYGTGEHCLVLKDMA